VGILIDRALMIKNAAAIAQLPSSKSRGGRDITKDAAKPPLMERTGWSGMRKHFGMPTILMFRAIALTLRARLRRREAQARKRAALMIRWASPPFFLVPQPPLLFQEGSFRPILLDNAPLRSWLGSNAAPPPVSDALRAQIWRPQP
jgi:hypothetical protein